MRLLCRFNGFGGEAGGGCWRADCRLRSRSPPPLDSLLLTLDLLAQVETAQHIGEDVAQGKGAGPHLQHALRVVGPRSRLAPEPRTFGILR
jgi:hypothetical protein